MYLPMYIHIVYQLDLSLPNLIRHLLAIRLSLCLRLRFIIHPFIHEEVDLKEVMKVFLWHGPKQEVEVLMLTHQRINLIARTVPLDAVVPLRRSWAVHCLPLPCRRFLASLLH